MKLSAAELAYVCSQDLYITEKCDACGKLLNQTFRYTIAGKPEVYCLALCRDRVFFGESYRVRNAGRQEAQKCAYCGGGRLAGEEGTRCSALTDAGKRIREECGKARKAPRSRPPLQFYQQLTRTKDRVDTHPMDSHLSVTESPANGQEEEFRFPLLAGRNRAKPVEKRISAHSLPIVEEHSDIAANPP